MTILLRPILRLFLFTALTLPIISSNSYALNWLEWSEQHFSTAKKANKFVLLNLEAVWCHWCHVMEEKTYSDPIIAKLLSDKFILIKVDQDSHPELSTRYQEWGWPATIIFNAEGTELRKMSGYIESQEMVAILKDVIQNPTAKVQKIHIEVPFASEPALTVNYRELLKEKHYKSLDNSIGGLQTNHKYIDFDTLEWALILASKDSQTDIEFCKLTLKSNLKLIDPIWGGVYQYSTNKNWEHPHFEKIVPSQANNIKIYSFAYSLWGEEESWKAATDIYRYLKTFLSSPEGAFYTSQDADLIKGQHSADYFQLGDTQRRAKGMPKIDKNIYSRENGEIISALTALYAATSNRIFLDDALKATSWIEFNRALPGNGFRHGAYDNEGPFLGDSLSMAIAYLNIYESSGERSWLKKSEKTAKFIIDNFSDISASKTRVPGFFIAKPNHSSVLKPIKTLSDNLKVVRYFNLLGHYTGNMEFIEVAKSAMQYVVTPESASGSINESGILVADYEMTRDPLHITIVGYKDDQLAKELFNAGLKYFAPYKRLEWWDKREGAMPNPDVEYPQMQRSAAFICTNKRCSLPIFKADGIAKTIKLFHKDER